MAKNLETLLTFEVESRTLDNVDLAIELRKCHSDSQVGTSLHDPLFSAEQVAVLVACCVSLSGLTS